MRHNKRGDIDRAHLEKSIAGLFEGRAGLDDVIDDKDASSPYLFRSERKKCPMDVPMPSLL